MAKGGKGRVRLVSRTVDKSGRVAFNQVVLEDATAPAGVLFAAVEPERGLSVWLRPHDVVEPEATVPQAPKYSRTIKPFGVTAPPDFLGPPVFFPKEDIPDWDGICALRTKALNHAIRDLLGIAD